MAFPTRHSGFHQPGLKPKWSMTALMKSNITRRQRAVRDSSKYNILENMKRERVADLRHERESAKGTTGVGLAFSASGAPVFRARSPRTPAPGQVSNALKKKLVTPKGINYGSSGA
jgi:hypothetical protein